MRQEPEPNETTVQAAFSDDDIQALKNALATQGTANLTNSTIIELGTSLLEFYELLAFDEEPLL